MSTFIFTALSFLLLYKYVTLFIVAYLAALLIPLPSNTTLLAAAAFASQGYLNIYAVAAVALIANILGDITGFYISYKYGKFFLMRIGLRKIIESKKYTNLEKFIVKNSRVTIFVTRFFGGVGPMVNILTGLSKNISLKRFLIYGISGEIVYVTSLVVPGYFLGDAFQDLMPSFGSISVGVAVLVAMYILYKVYFSNKE
jgi:membrane protein DedA with SNARE-associated domain